MIRQANQQVSKRQGLGFTDTLYGVLVSYFSGCLALPVSIPITQTRIRNTVPVPFKNLSMPLTQFIGFQSPAGINLLRNVILITL